MIRDLTQREYEAFLEELNRRGVDSSKMTMGKYAGEVARAAVAIGWVQMDVDQASPREVERVKREILKYVGDILEPDPN